MEERLAQNQPERTLAEGSVDLESVGSLPDWSCNDLEDAIQAGVGQSSPQLDVESHQDADENEEAAAGQSSENHNDSTSQIGALPSVQTAIVSSTSSAAPVPSLPDLLHSDRYVGQCLSIGKTAKRPWLTDSSPSTEISSTLTESTLLSQY